jgi:hypothetical protein
MTLNGFITIVLIFLGLFWAFAHGYDVYQGRPKRRKR